ncbi:MAG: DMT family transporter [Pseudomonadota bacterium]
MSAEGFNLAARLPAAARQPGVLQATAYMSVACAFFALMNVFVRLAADSGMDVIQIAFFRNLFALMAMLPWVISTGFQGLHTHRLGGHLGRAVIGQIAMVFWFLSVALLPMAEATALNFTFPLFGTILAALILKERVRARRWTATAVGFLGVLVILQPWDTQLAPVSFLPIGAAVFMACSAILVKQLSRTESAGTIVFYMNLFLTPIALVPALFVWMWPTWEIWLVLIALGACAALSHLSMTRAYAMLDASALQPLDYLRLPFVALFAFLAFGEIPSDWIWPGAAIIAASTFYIARREAQLARAARLARPPQGPQAPDGSP